MFCAICFFPPFLLAVLASVANASCPSGNDPNCAWGEKDLLGIFPVPLLYFVWHCLFASLLLMPATRIEWNGANGISLLYLNSICISPYSNGDRNAQNPSTRTHAAMTSSARTTLAAMPRPPVTTSRTTVASRPSPAHVD